jgi:hypothetical protein
MEKDSMLCIRLHNISLIWPIISIVVLLLIHPNKKWTKVVAISSLIAVVLFDIYIILDFSSMFSNEYLILHPFCYLVLIVLLSISKLKLKIVKMIACILFILLVLFNFYDRPYLYGGDPLRVTATLPEKH